MFAILEDPLIAWNLRRLDLILSVILFLSFVLIIGFLSRKGQIALSFTIISTVLVFTLLLVTHNDHGLPFFSFKF
jgi:hypothetical protein